MKKILLATTVLAGFAGTAFAQDAATGVKLSGYGRFGLVNDNSSAATVKKTTIHTRLRFNIDATTVTDSGVEFGGRIRVQSSQVGGGASLNDAQLHASYEGVRVEVGNTNTAYDSAALMWDAEMGFEDSSFGDPQEPTYSYSSKPIAGSGYMGVYASYSMGDFTVQASYVNPNQNAKTQAAGHAAESSIALSYSAGAFSVSAAAASNGAGVKGVDTAFIGAAYKINDVATVGLNYFDEDTVGGKTTTLYGNYKMDAITLRAYVANNDLKSNATKTAYGIGADYDLGGARLSGSIQRGYAKQTVVDMGVRFDF
ncbi:MAG: porin [Rhodobacteraceae bacterium]|nr:porin [Paracoccaceae bacterium]